MAERSVRDVAKMLDNIDDQIRARTSELQNIQANLDLLDEQRAKLLNELLMAWRRENQ